jgi:hypothetical protein
MNHQVDHCNANHRFTGFRERLVVFRQSTVFAEPREGPFNNPAFGQHFKAVRRSALHDLDGPAIPSDRPVDESAGITAVGEDQPQTSQPTGIVSQLLHQQLATIPILDIGRMHNQGHDQAQRVYDQMTLAAAYFLARVVATVPPFSAVLTDWLSRMPTEGVGCLPTLRRTRDRSRS